MKDDEKIFAELGSRATDSDHERELRDLCRELLVAFENKSSKRVTTVIGAKMQVLCRRKESCSCGSKEVGKAGCEENACSES